jgi:hypothetical protein
MARMTAAEREARRLARRQRDYAEIVAHARAEAERHGVVTDPATLDRVAAIFRGAADNPTAIWWVRFWCGHWAELSAHAGYETWEAAFGSGRRCPVCGLDCIIVEGTRRG